MKFIKKIDSCSSEAIYDYQHVYISKVNKMSRYIFVVKIFDLEFFVESEKATDSVEILDFVVKNDPNSGKWLLEYIIRNSIQAGKDEGRKEIQNKIQKLLGL